MQQWIEYSNRFNSEDKAAEKRIAASNRKVPSSTVWKTNKKKKQILHQNVNQDNITYLPWK